MHGAKFTVLINRYANIEKTQRLNKSKNETIPYIS